MRQRIGLKAITGLVMTAYLVACASTPAATNPPTSDQENTASPVLPAPAADHALQQTSRDTLVSSNREGDREGRFQEGSDQLTIRVWWPDELYPQTAEVADILNDQLEGFKQSYTIYDLDVRRKRTSGLGGILPTLRAAGPVAPSALPDLTLMRRSSLLIAVAEELIVPLEAWVPSDMIDNLLPGTRALGEVDGTLYGVPYALNITHVAYRVSVFEDPLLTFEDVLDQTPSYVFPASAGQGTQINPTVLLQYLAAGGRLLDESDSPTLDEDALRTVLTYYEQAVEQRVFDPELLEYTEYGSYWNTFVIGEANMVAVDTITYLSHKGDVQNVGLAPLPTADGTPVASLEGWMWVLTTRDPDRQEEARAFFRWMMDVSLHSTYTEAWGILPSQRRALRLWADEDYADFAQGLIGDAQVISGAVRNNSAAQALQEAMRAVLDGTTAQVAADEALAKLAQ